MLKTLALASALLCLSLPAEARHVHLACMETGTVLFPSCMGGDFLAGVKSIKVTLRRASHVTRKPRQRGADLALEPRWSVATLVGRPLHYIRGRLTCARNVNAALAERGIRGTGSALAHSFDHWGVRVPIPVVGAVAVTDRRRGGHVAIVSRVEGSRVFVFNPGRHGWQEREYTSRHARYRVAG